ncbi:MAG TPA: DUF6660 family protein [Chitinophagaceae bacterium]|nr:DUF6660 family protein [Chitinophagaceae bacterium]
MKTTAFILAIYFLFMGAVPCCEPGGCIDEIAKAGQSSGHEDNDHHCNNCSPFFNCECGCVVSIVVEHSIEAGLSYQASIAYQDFHSCKLTSVHLEFWQPPKIG